MFRFRSNFTSSSSAKTLEHANKNARILKSAQLHAQKIVSTLHAGYYKSFFTNSGLDYNYSRSYVFGDDIRHIDWNVTARLQNAYVKSFIENRERVLWLVCDVSSSMEIGAPRSLRALAAEIGATLLFLAHAYNDKTGGVIFSQDIHEVLRARRTDDVIPKMVSYIMQERKDNEKSNLCDALVYTKCVLSQRSLVVILSDFLTPKLEESIAIVADAHDVLLIRVLYDMHAMLPTNGGMKVQDTEGAAHAFYAFNDLRNAYKHSHELSTKRWQSFCKQHRTKTVDLRTTDSVLYELVAYMKNKHLSKTGLYEIA